MKNIMQRVDFNEEEQSFFIKLYDSLDAGFRAELEELKIKYCNPGDTPDVVNTGTENAIAAIAERIGVHKYSLLMLFLLLCSAELPARYRENGIDEKYAYTLLYDLRCKLTECRNCDHVFGTRTFSWFHNHYLLKRFGIGRFQYDDAVWKMDFDYDFNGIHVTKGDKAYSFHIPSSGKMTREMRLASYCEAHDFFGYKKGEPIVITCNSWLLFEGNRQVYPEGSNLADFLEDFDLLKNFEREKFLDAWRVFNRDYDGDTSVLPRDTSLQRGFIDYIEKGGKFGNGFGVILCDGERIINNKRDN